MESILVATNLSALFDRAGRCAVEIAGRHRARLCVAHVVDDELPAKVAERQKHAAETALQDSIGGRLEQR